MCATVGTCRCCCCCCYYYCRCTANRFESVRQNFRAIMCAAVGAHWCGSNCSCSRCRDWSGAGLATSCVPSLAPPAPDAAAALPHLLCQLNVTFAPSRVPLSPPLLPNLLQLLLLPAAAATLPTSLHLVDVTFAPSCVQQSAPAAAVDAADPAAVVAAAAAAGTAALTVSGLFCVN